MTKLTTFFREWIGLTLLEWAFKVLPRDLSVFEGIARGLREQAAYEHYEGYTRLLKQAPLPFDRWREQWAWIQAKARMTDGHAA